MSVNPEQILKHVEVTGEALSLATKIAEEACAREALAGEYAGDVLKKLSAAGLIGAAEEKRAHQQLLNHRQSLEILANVIDHYQGELADQRQKSASVRPLGQPEQPPQTGGRYVPGYTKNANYLGRRDGACEPIRESDIPLLRLIGRA